VIICLTANQNVDALNSNGNFPSEFHERETPSLKLKLGLLYCIQVQGGICAPDQWGGYLFKFAVRGNKHPCLGQAVKMQWLDD